MYYVLCNYVSSITSSPKLNTYFASHFKKDLNILTYYNLRNHPNYEAFCTSTTVQCTITNNSTKRKCYHF